MAASRSPGRDKRVARSMDPSTTAVAHRMTTKTDAPTISAPATPAIANPSDAASAPPVHHEWLRQSVTSERGIDAGLLEYLHDQQLLLVLDNLEQVLSSAPLIAELLQAAPDVRVLATSRAPLRIYGEYELRVPPLRLPSPGAPAREVLASDAVALFIQRARAARADFEPGLEQAKLLEAICRRLDGLPLAIELAAARVRHVSLGQLRERLTRSLEILDHGPRDVPDRQRTLRATLDWSYQLLPPDRQRLLMQLGSSSAAVRSRPWRRCVPTVLSTSKLRFGTWSTTRSWRL
jgi:predicted ATPase